MLTHKHPDLLGADVIANGVVGTIVGIYPPVDTARNRLRRIGRQDPQIAATAGIVVD